MLEEQLKLQQEIMQNHSSSKELSLLRKYSQSSAGASGMFPVNISARYGLVGLNNSDCYNFLPHFEYNIDTHYQIEVPGGLAAGDVMQITFAENGQEINLKTKDSKGVMTVNFGKVDGLFQLRNLASEGNLLSILKTYEDRNKLPFEEDQIKCGFNFRISSASYGQYVAFMPIDHPNAEKIIKQFLETIDQKFNDYFCLAHHWKQGSTQPNYSSEEKRVQKLLFKEVKRIFKKNKMKCYGYSQHSFLGNVSSLLRRFLP